MYNHENHAGGNDSQQANEAKLFSKIELPAAGQNNNGANQQKKNQQPQQKKKKAKNANQGNNNQNQAAKAKKQNQNAKQKNQLQPRQKVKQENSNSQQAPKQKNKSKKQNTQQASSNSLKIIPLGGIGEIGKNMTVYEQKNSMIIVDCGMSFPDSDLFGIDVVIPDYSYVLANKDKLKALFITHGHEDHIGALPYLLKEVHVPVYASRLTVGLIKGKLEEHRVKADLRVMSAGEVIQVDSFKVEAIGVNHSIPDAMAFAITTEQGVVVQTGDFKIDYTPIFGDTIDLRRLGELGTNGVLALLSDSTNAERPGTSTSERTVGESFERLFSRAEGKRLIIATFASNIQRVQQIIDLAKRHKRKIAISGRSMENYSRIAMELGYLETEDGLIIDMSEINRHRPEDLIIITTGSQGEPMSALSRMAAGNHKQISITNDDVIIISASPIPGNEKTVARVVNDLLRLGSDVIYESMYDVHSSGHACKDELKLIMNLTKPKYFIPVHGEYKHLIKHANIARDLGIKDQNIILPDLGKVMEFSNGGVKLSETVTSGRVLVDGYGVGDVGSVVLRDRKHLAEDGLLVVVCTIDIETKELISGPDIISRGFVYVREAEPLLEEARKLVRDIINECFGENVRDWNDIKIRVREQVGELMYQRTKRNPMILPVIMDI